MSEKTEKNELTDKSLADAGFTKMPEVVPKKTVTKAVKPMAPVVVPKIVVKPVKVEPAVPKPLPSDLVKVKVLVGTLGFEQGTFQRGAVFQTTRERAEKFDKRDVQISELK